VQCSRFARTLYDIATHSWLGGQHGEEEKVEDEVSGEKGRKEKVPPEEEVDSRYFPVFDFALMSMAASNGPVVVEQR
jgi:hypothetical protein